MKRKFSIIRTRWDSRSIDNINNKILYLSCSRLESKSKHRQMETIGVRYYERKNATSLTEIYFQINQRNYAETVYSL